MITPPPFDTELAAVLDAIGRRSIATGITLEMLHSERQTLLASIPTLKQLRADCRFESHEVLIPGPDDCPTIPLLVMRPRGLTGLRPIIFHTHGGGLMMGNNRYALDPLLEWALQLQVIIVSVEYRLAPEHPYPAGLDDAYTALAWTIENGMFFSGDSTRVVLAGGSAGGNLAASLALLARDRGQIDILGQILMSPMLDDRNDSVSSNQMRGRGVWDHVSNDTGWRAWLGEAYANNPPPYAAPARATELSGLPPTFLDVGSAETFRDETVSFAQRLWEAGGDAELHVWAGAFHGFDIIAPQAQISQRARAARMHWLGRLIGE